MANPAPIGFFATALTIFIFSLYNLQVRGITVSLAGVGMAAFFGGFCQTMAGMWAFSLGNTFASNAFVAYGGFWLSYTPFLIPGFLTEAYAAHPGQLPDATGIIFAAWTIVTTIFLLGTLRVNVVLVLFFFLLDVYFITITISEFTRSLTLQKVAGGEGLALSLVAFYAGAANLLTEENSWFTLPMGNLSRE